MPLAYDEAGTGRPLILLHAFPLDRRMWAGQLVELSGFARLIAVDLPGFGDSTHSPDLSSVDEAARAVGELLDSLRLSEPVTVCGLSMGGYVALALARLMPDRLNGLILCDTRADADDASARAGRDRTIALAETSGVAAVVEQMIPKLLCETTREGIPDMVQLVREMGDRQRVKSVTSALAALRDRPAATASLAEIRVPTMVIVGEHDAATPPDLSRAMASRIPGCQLRVIPEAGHLSNLENPAAFNAALREYLGGRTTA